MQAIWLGVAGIQEVLPSKAALPIDSHLSKLFDHCLNIFGFAGVVSMLQQSAVQLSATLQAPGVIQSLERVRDRVKEQLIKVPEYRAFLAIETSIAEVSHIPDLVVHLASAKEKILDRLMTVREYRAMLAVEKSIQEISEVLGVLADGESAVSQTEVSEPPEPEMVVAPEVPLEESEAVSAADRLAKVLGLTPEPFDNRIS
jgi:hypothetical protein